KRYEDQLAVGLGAYDGFVVLFGILVDAMQIWGVAVPENRKLGLGFSLILVVLFCLITLAYKVL
ncbi:hypothetical protein ACJX0J_018827, partial [Zea mays]